MSEQQDQMDREATAFAMELLMPTEFIRAELAKMPPLDIDDQRSIEQLAKKFKVSPQVMLLRLACFPR